MMHKQNGTRKKCNSDDNLCTVRACEGKFLTAMPSYVRAPARGEMRFFTKIFLFHFSPRRRMSKVVTLRFVTCHATWDLSVQLSARRAFNHRLGFSRFEYGSQWLQEKPKDGSITLKMINSFLISSQEFRSSFGFIYDLHS
jgi:hypothetical protein